MRAGSKIGAVCVLSAAAWLGTVPGAHAGFDQTFTGSQGSLSASARFHQVGNQLIVTLANTSSADVISAGQVLTAVFFNIDPTASLTRVSAVLGANSTVLYAATQPANGIVSPEWGFASNLSGTPGNAALGISSSGLGLFSPATRFSAGNLAGPISLNGVEYGITSAGDNPATSNGSIGSANPVIQNSVVFTLGLPTDYAYTLEAVTGVVFQYGTGLSETRIFAPVPEPTTLIAGALLLLPFGLSTILRLRKKT